MTLLSTVSEELVLEAVARRLRRPWPGIALGVGDDAALVRDVGPHAVLSADMLIEGVDFELSWASFAEVGHKAAAANLSDLAAMGAEPRALLLSLGLRPNDHLEDVLALVSRLDAVGRRFGAPLVGGDLSRTTGPLIVSVAAVGRARARRALLRRRGKPGDVVLVSGCVGGAALGLRQLVQGARRSRFTRRQLVPKPRVALGLALARAGVVRSAADVSDGLAKDALHLCRPGAGVVLDCDRLPLEPGLVPAARRLGLEPFELALAGGEDFELVVAVAPRQVDRAVAMARKIGVPLTAIGELVRGYGLRLRGAPLGLEARGFDHFRA
jgi:thiamine-monophosphate kinase